MLTIEISGPMGNALHIINQSKTFAKQLDWSAEEIAALEASMMGPDASYERTLKLFDRHFGQFCTLTLEGLPLFEH